MSIITGGYHHLQSNAGLENRVGAPRHERINIHICRPLRPPLQIEGCVPSSIERKILSDVRNSDSRVAGTLSYGCLILYPHDYFSTCRGIGYRSELKMTEPRTFGGGYGAQATSYTSIVTKNYNFNTMDLTNIFESNFRPKDGCNCNIPSDDGSPKEKKMKMECKCVQTPCVLCAEQYGTNIQCVIQQPIKGAIRFVENKLLSALNDNTSADPLVWEFILNRCPPELYEVILKFMDFDHVSWLVAKNERFARLHAKARYNIDETKYTDTRSLLLALRREASKEMRFTHNEDLWIASFGSRRRGVARRFRIRAGTYRWHLAAAITSVRFDSYRARCQTCTQLLGGLRSAMESHQDTIENGQTRTKVFSLAGGENFEIDDRFASPLFKDNTSSKSAFSVHMWAGDVGNRWLLDMKSIDGRPLTARDYFQFAFFNTLIFKDPVKFFGTSKLFHVVDRGIIAISTEHTGEVVGYLIEDQEVRFRIHGRDCIGLNFLPSKLYEETRATALLIKHVRRHEIQKEINATVKMISSLRNNVLDVEEELHVAFQHLQRLNQTKDNGYPLTLIRLVKECKCDGTVAHVHEQYHEGFEFCVSFMFVKLGESATLLNRKLNYELRFLPCLSFQIGRDCILAVINPQKLRSTYAVLYKNKRIETDV